jgi:hypothetical protein
MVFIGIDLRGVLLTWHAGLWKQMSSEDGAFDCNGKTTEAEKRPKKQTISLLDTEKVRVGCE